MSETSSQRNKQQSLINLVRCNATRSNLARDASYIVAACAVTPNVQVEGLTSNETARLGLQLAEAVKRDILRQKVGRLPIIMPWHT